MGTLGIIGFGSFGQFITPHLKKFYNITVTNRSDKSSIAKELGVKYATLEETASCDVVILCVPVQYLEDTLLKIKNHVKPKSMIVDVSSVKVKPIELMMKHLPSTVEIIGTHPLFGPQSGKNGIQGLNIVVCSVRSRRGNSLCRFLSDNYRLNVLERSPEVHDKQMAYVQALTHFIGRAVNEMDIPDVEQKTKAYEALLEVKRTLGRDSMDLFLTIENENPYAKEVREQFIQELKLLNDRLD